MAEFNAGSIIGSLDIDRDPFSQGLDLAKQQAQTFENDTKPVVKVDADTAEATASLDSFKEKSDALGNITIKANADTSEADAKLGALDTVAKDLDGKSLTIKANADTTEADVQLAATKAVADDLDGKTVKIQVNADTAAADVEMAATSAEADRLSGKTVKIKVDESGASTSLKKLSLDLVPPHAGLQGLVALGLSVAPALAPIGGVLAGIGVGAVGAFTTAGVGLGAFAAVAKSDFTDMKSDATALNKAQAAFANATTTKAQAKALSDLAIAQGKLHGPIGQAATAYSQMDAAWLQVKKDTSGAVFGDMIAAFHLLTGLIPTLVPIVNITAGALAPVIGMFSGLINSPSFARFISTIENEIPPVVTGLGKILVDLAKGFMNLFVDSAPFVNIVVIGVSNLAASFLAWTQNKGASTMQSFLKYVHDNAPAVKNLLEIIAKTVGDLFKALASGGNGSDAISGLAGIFKSLDSIEKGPLMIILPLLSSTIKLLGPFAGPMALLVISVKDLAGPLQAATGFIGLFGAGGALAGVELLPLLATVGLIVIAVIALGLGAYELIKHWHSVVDFFKGIPNDIKNAFNDIVSFFRGPWGTIALLIMLPIAPFIAAPALIILNWGKIESFFEALPGKIKGFLQDIINFFKGPWGNAILGVVAAFNPFIGIPLLIIKNWGTIEPFLKKMWNDVISDFSKGWDAIVSGAKAGYKAVLNFFSTLKNDIVNVFKDAATWLKDMGDKITTGLWNGIKAGFLAVTNFFGDIGSRFVGWFKTAATWLENIGKSIIKGLYNGIWDIWNTTVRDLFGNIGSRIMGWFSNAGSWLYNIGKAIINGLWNGAKSVWSSVSGWFTSKANDVKNIFSDVLQVASPSRVFHNIGAFVMQGFHNGIQDTYNSLVKPNLQKIASEIATTFNPQLSASAELALSGSVAINAQTNATQNLADSLVNLRGDIQALPSATGAAVGATVADKITSASVASTNRLITSARKR